MSRGRMTGWRRRFSTIRDHAIDRWMEFDPGRLQRTGAKRVYYFSVEFLIGRLLRDAISNLGMVEPMRDGADQPRRRPRRHRRARARRRPRQWRPRPARRLLHGVDGDRRDPGLWLRHPLRPRPLPPGDQGRPAGRAARGLAVAPQSLGIRAARSELRHRLRRHRRGRAVSSTTRPASSGSRRRRILAVAFDTPMVGWRGRRVNTLRLWSAQAVDPIRLEAFNRGDYTGALADLTRAETITRVLYPADFDSGRTGTAAAPGVLLHLGLAAGHRPPPLPAVRQGAATCRRRSPSSSTTPIRRSRSPS